MVITKNQTMQQRKQIDDVIELLKSKKAIDIEMIDTSADSRRMSDYVVIASGTSARHVQTVSEHVSRFFKHCHTEGSPNSGWVLIESDGIEVHLFKPELRNFYDLHALLA